MNFDSCKYYCALDDGRRGLSRLCRRIIVPSYICLFPIIADII